MKLIKIEVDKDKPNITLESEICHEKIVVCSVVLTYKNWFGRTKIIKATPIEYRICYYSYFMEPKLTLVDELGNILYLDISKKIFNFIKAQNL